MENIKELLGKKIKELRKAKKYTQEQLAEKVGIGTPNISYFETGKFSPSVDTLQKIAEVLDVEIYELYMFQPLKSINEIRTELISGMDSDEKILRMLYKFYLSIK
ncbi:MAG: helix-turn-helix domain-containing protein [Candidatus Gastranaerophilales bacterium]|nr:helix-turn-helix domain-containing protein [Candidatus Gastranaerophilales bacterium]